MSDIPPQERWSDRRMRRLPLIVCLLLALGLFALAVVLLFRNVMQG